MPLFAVHRQRVLEDARLRRSQRRGELAREHRRQLRRHHLGDVLADELLRRREEHPLIPGVIIEVDAVGADHEHQVGHRVQQRRVSRLAVMQRALRLPPPRAMHEQHGHQQQLHHDHRRGNSREPPVVGQT